MHRLTGFRLEFLPPNGHRPNKEMAARYTCSPYFSLQRDSFSFLSVRACVCVCSLSSLLFPITIPHSSSFLLVPFILPQHLSTFFCSCFFKPRHQNETSHSDWPIGKGGCRRCLFYKRAFKGNPVKKTNQKNSVSRLFNPSLTFPRLVSVFFSARRSLTRFN